MFRDFTNTCNHLSRQLNCSIKSSKGCVLLPLLLSILKVNIPSLDATLSCVSFCVDAIWPHLSSLLLPWSQFSCPGGTGSWSFVALFEHTSLLFEGSLFKGLCFPSTLLCKLQDQFNARFLVSAVKLCFSAFRLMAFSCFSHLSNIWSRYWDVLLNMCDEVL